MNPAVPINIFFRVNHAVLLTDSNCMFITNNICLTIERFIPKYQYISTSAHLHLYICTYECSNNFTYTYTRTSRAYGLTGHAILVHILWVNLEDYGTKVGSMQYSPERHKGRISAVQSRQSKWTGQYKKCVQYDFKFTSIYTLHIYSV